MSPPQARTWMIFLPIPPAHGECTKMVMLRVSIYEGSYNTRPNCGHREAHSHAYVRGDVV